MPKQSHTLFIAAKHASRPAPVRAQARESSSLASLSLPAIQGPRNFMTHSAVTPAASSHHSIPPRCAQQPFNHNINLPLMLEATLQLAQQKIGWDPNCTTHNNIKVMPSYCPQNKQRRTGKVQQTKRLVASATAPSKRLIWRPAAITENTGARAQKARPGGWRRPGAGKSGDRLGQGNGISLLLDLLWPVGPAWQKRGTVHMGSIKKKRPC
eukprot:286620-Pelagomonas_calceolata.AAC.2